MIRRHGADTQIQVPAADGDLDAPVLRNALLRDLHLRHDLEARENRTLQALRRRVHLAERAIDAVADAELLLHRLDVDIGRLHLDRRRDDHVGELDDRAVIAGGRVVGPVLITRRNGRVGAVGVNLVHRRLDLGNRRKDRVDVLPRQHVAKRIDGIVAHRVDERDRHGRLVRDHGDDPVLLRDVGGNRPHRLFGDRLGVQMAIFETKLVGDRAEDGILVDHPAGQKRVQRRLVLGLHRLRGGKHLLGGEIAALGQKLNDIFVVASHFLWRILYPKDEIQARALRVRAFRNIRRGAPSSPNRARMFFSRKAR